MYIDIIILLYIRDYRQVLGGCLLKVKYLLILNFCLDLNSLMCIF